jgi:hypothetical protein
MKKAIALAIQLEFIIHRSSFIISPPLPVSARLTYNRLSA